MQYGLPHQTRLWLLQQRRPNRMGMHAMFIDYLLTIMRLEPGDTFTYTSIKSDCTIMDEKTIRAILKTELFPNIPSDQPTPLFRSTVDLAATTSRKPRKYIVESGKQYAELTNTLGFFESPLWYTLPLRAFESGKSYREEVYHAHIDFFPGDHSRNDISSSLGMTNRALRNLDKGARIIVTPNYRIEQVHYTDPRLVADGDKPPGNVHIQAGETKYAATMKNALLLTEKGVDWRLYIRLANSYWTNDLA